MGGAQSGGPGGFQAHVEDLRRARREEVESRADFDEVARQCCRTGLEEGIFRALGVSLGVLPEVGVPYLDIDDDLRRSIIAQRPEESDFLQDAFEVKG